MIQADPETSRFGRLLLLVAAFCCATIVAHAQSENPPTITAPPAVDVAADIDATESDSPPLDESVRQNPGRQAKEGDADPHSQEPSVDPPDVYWMPDKDGELQKILGFSYEDFLELLRAKQGLLVREESPRFTITDLSIDAKLLRADLAKLSARIDIVLHSEGRVEVPLGFGDAILVDVEQNDDASHNVVRFDETKRQFVAWLHGKPGDQHTVRLKLLRQLEISDRTTRLALVLPKAAISKLEMLSPREQVEMRATSGAVEIHPATNGDSIARVQGASGDFSLSWTSEPSSSPRSQLLQSTGAIMTTVDGRGVVSDARLTIESLTGLLEAFRVRLPSGARLRSAGEGDYTWERVGESTPGLTDDRNGFDEPNDGDLIEFRLATPQSKPVEVRIITEQPLEDLENDAWTSISGFTVVGALRQYGHVGLRAEKHWRLEWEPSDATRQTADLPDSLRGQNLLAGFEYFRSDWRIRVRVSPRNSRVAVATDQLLVVDRDNLLWRGTLTFSTQGSSLFAVRLWMPGWDIEADDIDPATIVDAAGMTRDETGEIMIPLREPLDGSATISLTARRRRPIESGRLEVELPEVRRAVTASGKLTVAAPSYLALSPDNASCRGIESLPTPTDVSLPVRLWGPTFRSYRVYSAGARFVAEVEQRPQSIHAESNADVVLEARGAHVNQTITWQVQNEPIERLQFEAPIAWNVVGGNAKVTCTLDGEPALLEPTQGGTGSADSSNRVEIRLKAPKAGQIVTEFQYALDYADASESANAALELQLAAPVAEKTSPDELHIESAIESGVTFELSKESRDWKISETESSAVSGARTLTANSPSESARLVIQRAQVVARPDVIVHRALFLSNVYDDTEKTRLSMILNSRKDAFAFRIAQPADAIIDEILLDGRIAPYELDGEGRIVVRFGEARSEATRRFELVLRRARPSDGAEAVALPQLEFDDDIAFRGVYWRIITPWRLHLLASPQGWTSENQWMFQNGVGRRLPTITDTELSTWAGNSAGMEAPQGANVYVFSAFDLPVARHARMVSRSMLVLCASGIALALGLLVLYFPSMRSPLLFLCAGVALSALAILFQDAVILITQASLLGILLVPVAVLLHNRLKRPAIGVSDVVSTGSTVSRRSAARFPAVKPTFSGGSTSPTAAPAAVPSHSSDGGVK